MSGIQILAQVGSLMGTVLVIGKIVMNQLERRSSKLKHLAESQQQQLERTQSSSNAVGVASEPVTSSSPVSARSSGVEGGDRDEPKPRKSSKKPKNSKGKAARSGDTQVEVELEEQP